MNGWYETLQRPALTPPDWVFTPVWTILYVMIAISLFLFVKYYRKEKRYGMYVLIVIHLIANFAWTGIFFGLQAPGLAFIDIIVLDITLIVMVLYFWHINRMSSIFLWPYLLWILFATYLNAAFFMLNRV